MYMQGAWDFEDLTGCLEWCELHGRPSWKNKPQVATSQVVQPCGPPKNKEVIHLELVYRSDTGAAGHARFRGIPP